MFEATNQLEIPETIRNSWAFYGFILRYRSWYPRGWTHGMKHQTWVRINVVNPILNIPIW